MPTPTPQTVSVKSCDVEQIVTAPGNLINVNIAEVKMPVRGKLSVVNVRVGDVVQAGQTLAELNAVAAIQAKLDLLEAQVVMEKTHRTRTTLDYPRATDDYFKDLRKRSVYRNRSSSNLKNYTKKLKTPFIKHKH